MLEGMIDFFVSGFVYPGILWNQVLLGIGLAIVFGAKTTLRLKTQAERCYIFGRQAGKLSQGFN